MHIYVHLGVRHLQKQQHDGKNGGRNYIAVGFNDRVLNEPVTNQPSVDEDVNLITNEFLEFRLGNKSMRPQLAGR